MSNSTLQTSETQLYRSERYSVIGGVCAGVALARGYSISLVRLISLFLLSTGVGLLLYIVLWAVLPRATKAGVEEPLSLPADTLQRNGNDRMIGGVCSGLATYFRTDKSLVRIVYALLVVSFGVGILPYFYAWIALPVRR